MNFHQFQQISGLQGIKVFKSCTLYKNLIYNSHCWTWFRVPNNCIFIPCIMRHNSVGACDVSGDMPSRNLPPELLPFFSPWYFVMCSSLGARLLFFLQIVSPLGFVTANHLHLFATHTDICFSCFFSGPLPVPNCALASGGHLPSPSPPSRVFFIHHS